VIVRVAAIEASLVVIVTLPLIVTLRLGDASDHPKRHSQDGDGATDSGNSARHTIAPFPT
jgi:hypothetical protein